MSEFLMIVPEGWVEVTAEWVGVTNSVEEVQFWVMQQAWTDLEPILKEYGAVPENMKLSNARLIPISSGFRLWVMFEPA